MNRRIAGSTMRILSVALVLAMLVLVSGYASAQPRSVTLFLVQEAKLTASDGAEDDSFGRSVSISGDTLVVGANWDDGTSYDFGSAYVFERDEGGSGNWGEVTKLTASDGAQQDYFGSSVSISGDTLVVGAPGDDGTSYDFGSAYLFERDEGGLDNWGEVAKLTASDGVEFGKFGTSVSISGDTLVVGGAGGDDSGSAYVYERDEGGPGNWGQVAKLTASDGALQDYFGFSVSISGDTVIIGAYGDYPGGSAYLFEKPVDGWDDATETTKLVATDGVEYGGFGYSVAMSGDTVVVTAPGDDDNGENSGSAYVFERDEGGPGNWGQVAKLTASDGTAYDFFGESVSVSGDTVVAGAIQADNGGTYSGSAYVFERDEGGPDSWGQVAKLTASDGAYLDAFGKSVSISGDTVVIGAHADDDLGDHSGSAYVFAAFEPIAWVYLPVVLRNAP